MNKLKINWLNKNLTSRFLRFLRQNTYYEENLAFFECLFSMILWEIKSALRNTEIVLKYLVLTWVQQMYII